MTISASTEVRAALARKRVMNDIDFDEFVFDFPVYKISTDNGDVFVVGENREKAIAFSLIMTFGRHVLLKSERFGETQSLLH